jgi:hypothetical protein
MLTRQEIEAHVKDHLHYVLMPTEYPMGYVIRVALLDLVITAIGVGLVLTPVALGFLPGAFDTTVHVALGALIATLGLFRVLLAHGSAWVEIVLIALGVLVLRLPHFMHMEWNDKYTMGHMGAGGVVIVLAIISGLMTWAHMKKQRSQQ